MVRIMSLQRPLNFALTVVLGVVLSTLVVFTSARAHEVQPAIMDVTIGEDTLDITIDWMIEAAVAGLDLQELSDTNDADDPDAYDSLRALPPDAMAEELRNAWPGIAAQIDIAAGERRLPLALGTVEVPQIDNVELARISTLTLSAPLPADDTAISIGWDPSLGPLVVRQQGVENGYAGYLEGGESSPR